ncbi:class I SAM-dependent methyltransferase [Fulvimarina endophytica]|uniref:Class I SAM-dependent methyltransferase n=1 Tax=Fulvimarina endophytica TaxID=2293836 RepID=A0A371XB17_9HYPH|nr:class I SAM-dependent methyltransferase [Fulvimarina endophytica]RFC66433.1 class I SAM-dependent methyltransferase [Fulvimarina endophytica]
MLSHTFEFMKRAEQNASNLEELRKMIQNISLDEFGEILLRMPDNEFPKLSEMLPAMASQETQHIWTGGWGDQLLSQSTSFVNTLTSSYADIVGKPLDSSRVLDFGCGWGRLLRLMLYHCDQKLLYGCDAYEPSLSLAKNDGIPANLALSDVHPKTLPFRNVKFDLVYAFSVFTHLSERSAWSALAAIRKSISNDGLLLITVRPEEFWSNAVSFASPINPDDYMKMHRRNGCAWLPGTVDEVDGDIPYGDISFSIEYLTGKLPNWSIVRSGRTLLDPYQVFVWLRPS